MKSFLDENFLLNNKSAIHLYHQYAKPLPIIDYHNHLSPEDVASNRRFDNISQAWLYGDHYKWRAMRANGVHESFITGDKTDWEKFNAWASTVPYTLRNPLFHWTHLELQRYFNIHEILNGSTAKNIYEKTAAALASPDYGARYLIERMDVELICTTDDPIDNLQSHRQFRSMNSKLKMLPAFRPDKAMNVDDAVVFNGYLGSLERASDISITTYDDYLTALKNRHDYFATNQCAVSDHGLEEIYSEDYSAVEIRSAFASIRSGQNLTMEQNRKFKSAMLINFAEWDFEKGFVQQYHLGALRNNNSRMTGRLGADTGWDSIGDFPQARPLAKFLNRLDSEHKLPKTILYNLNPGDNEVFASMAGNFNDGSETAKIQWGSSWWFLDQKDGMTKQINALSNLGLLSRFVGMLTDSRSFLSFPRHEYFRRILCNILGEEMENGELPNDPEWIGSMIGDICYRNARQYFNWNDLLPAKI